MSVLLQNKHCEFITHMYKFKWLFLPKKTVFDVDIYDF